MKKRTVHSKNLFNKNHDLAQNQTIVIAYQIKTPENIGNIIRLADNAGCKKVIIATDDENIRISKVRKTAGLSFDSMSWEICPTFEVLNKIPAGYKIVSVETSSDSENIFTSNLPEKVAIIVGNEIVGIDDEILNKSDQIVHIPLLGHNTSMNVSHALAVALFEWFRKQTYNY
ncbi:MAG: TrmH family RNA methyltransferase [Bacteroidales bacterium]